MEFVKGEKVYLINEEWERGEGLVKLKSVSENKVVSCQMMNVNGRWR